MGRLIIEKTPIFSKIISKFNTITKDNTYTGRKYIQHI